MKKIINYLILIGSIFLLFIAKVNANTINKIDMDIYIDTNGNGHITEVWQANLTSGTEGYRPYSGLGNKEITNFIVTDENNVTYETLASWNTSATFDSKAYKCGYNKTSSGVELCWGITKYGNRTYTLKYDISNLVTKYTDTEGLHFTFLKLDQNVGNVTITVHSDYSFSLDNAKIWSFGNYGTINFDNGNIVFDSNGTFSKGNYMTMLIRFESNIFDTTNTSTKSFDDIYDDAFGNYDPSKETSEDNYYFYHTVVNNDRDDIEIIFSLIFDLLFVGVVFYIIYSAKKPKDILSGCYYYKFENHSNRLPKDKNIEYYRDIPCDGNIELAFWICYYYNIIDKNKLLNGLIGAILLRWIQKGYVTVIKDGNDYSIDLSKMEKADNESEEKLLEMLRRVTGDNKILESKEFAKWSKKNYGLVKEFFKDVVRYMEKDLTDKGIITGKYTKTVNESLQVEAINIKGLKKFLLNFSNIADKTCYEVHLWENYLIFAELMGIADEVNKEFNKLYPEFIKESAFDTSTYVYVNTRLAEVCIRNATRGFADERRRQANMRSGSFNHDYSGGNHFSGGGGSSFHSGGGHSGGSSGGGFR